MALQEETVEKMFITEEGQEVPKKNVCFKGEGKPYLLYTDENGERVITDMPLVEVEVKMTVEKDSELSSLS